MAFVIWIILVALTIAGMWKSFEKAGQPGWAAIIPIYNIIVLLQIIGKPLWWIVLFFIPIVGFIVFILVNIKFAEKFGKGAGFGIGLSFLAFIFYPMLGFGDAQFVGGAPA
jgi:hypothetical protein